MKMVRHYAESHNDNVVFFSGYAKPGEKYKIVADGVKNEESIYSVLITMGEDTSFKFSRYVFHSLYDSLSADESQYSIYLAFPQQQKRFHVLVLFHH